MATRETISIKPDPKQLAGVYEAFKKMDEGANNQLKDEVSLISAWTAQQIKNSAAALPRENYPKQAARVADTVRFNKDRIPNVTIGGSKRNFSGGAYVGEVLFGSEFGAVEWLATGEIGANRFGKYGGRRFPERSPRLGKGNAGWWIFPTLRRDQETITKRWQDAVTRAVIRKWDN